MSIKGTDEAWENRELGNDERYAAPYEDINSKAARLEYEIEKLEESNAELGKDLAWQKQYAMRWEKAATVAMNELDAERAEGEEQARLLGISGSREAKLLAELVELDHCRQEAERAEMLAKEVEALKVAYDAACAFIDSHVADPDITAEMREKHAVFVDRRNAARGEK